MVIRRLKIRNFGKIQNKTLELSPGINVLYGENESGKTTLHTFIKTMLYGMTRQRGRAAKNDLYTTYEPWENPADYGGILWFTSGNQDFRLTRRFYKENPTGELFSETTGALSNADKDTMEKVLGEVSEAVYDNTVSVAQLKSVTGSDLVRELQNYMAGYQGTGDSSMDLGRASQMLKMSRKGFQVQSDRRQKELEKEKTKLAANMEYLKTEMDDLQEKRVQVEEAKENLRTGKNVQEGESILQDRIIQVQNRQLLTRVLLVAALVIGVGLGAAVFRGVIPRMLSIGGGILLALAGIYYDRKLGRELHKRQRTKARWLAKQEKLSWDGGNLDASYAEKELAYKNLQAEYAECEEQQYLPGTEDLEIRALNMALETIEKLSGNINNHLGEGLRRRTSEILSEITGGKYQEVLMDKDFHMSVNTQDRVVPLERLSRGTMEQIYFALRMAAGDMFCEQEPFPVILDDVFGMYDEDRLAAVLRWLHKEQRQTIISTCHKREMELLDREGIPYQKLILE